MKTINQIIEHIRSGKNLHEIKLMDASRYVSNAKGEMLFNPTLWCRRHAPKYNPTDEIADLGREQTNVSEVERILRSLIGKGDVRIWLSGENPEVGEIKE